MNEKTSIIVSTYDQNMLSRNITALCLNCIEMYTDHEDYELILVDNEPFADLNMRNTYCKIDKHIINEKDPGFSAAINQGVRASDPNNKYLCFIHPDVFVQEGWLKGLMEDLNKNNASAVWPMQRPMNRDRVKAVYEGTGGGADDAGLNFLTRDIYNKMGGLNEVFQTIYHDAALRTMVVDAGGQTYMSRRVIINHIGAGTLESIWYTKFQERRGPEGEELSKINKQ